MDVYLEGECMDIEFSSVKQLYDRLLPALKTKELDLKRNNINYIKKEDIWNYLKITKWSGAKDLLLHQMVDDILNVDDVLLRNYVEDNLRKNIVEPNLKSEGFMNE